MWRNVGIEWSGDRLMEPIEILSLWSRYVMDKTFDSRINKEQAIAGWELQNMISVSVLVTLAANARTESRGTHYRLDHPDRDDKNWRVHLQWQRPSETPKSEPV